MSNEAVISAAVAIIGAILTFIKFLINKKNAVREILERQIDQLEKRNIELEKETAELTRLLIRRGRK